MKKIFLLMALLCVTTLVFAQSSTQTATLKHGDEINVFYGADAFIDAQSSATTGDIITLSSGSFNAPELLTKAITLRGVGCVNDDELNLQPTSISGIFRTSISDTVNHLTVEGVLFVSEFCFDSLIAPVFIRCNFEFIHNIGGYWTQGIMLNPLFINCRIHSINNTGMKNTTLQNCVIWSYYDGNEENTYAYNSYLWLDGSPQRLSVYNCIVSGIGQMVGWSAAYNSVSIEKNFNNCSNYDCWFFDEYDMVFESFTGEDYVWTTEPLILKAEVASQCLGVDGNQVGIHGGNMPYATRPTYMTSYRTTVDQHSTSDGKLNVHIEVVEGDK